MLAYQIIFAKKNNAEEAISHCFISRTVSSILITTKHIRMKSFSMVWVEIKVQGGKFVGPKYENNYSS